jgi:hypothetical protein
VLTTRVVVQIVGVSEVNQTGRPEGLAVAETVAVPPAARLGAVPKVMV